MANNDDANTDATPPTEQPKLGVGAKLKLLLAKPAVKLVLLVIFLLALLSGISFATLSYLGLFDSSDDATELVAKDLENKGAESEKAESESPENKVGSVSYYPLEPEFIVNFMAHGRQRYMQLGLSVKVADVSVIALIVEHEPLLRSRIIMLLSAKDYVSLQTDDGRNTLRQELLELIQTSLTKETGKPIVEDIYFTSYVLQ